MKKFKNIVEGLSYLIIINILAIAASYLFGLFTPLIRKIIVTASLIEIAALFIVIIGNHRHSESVVCEENHPHATAHGSDYSKSKFAVWSQIAATGLIGIAGVAFTITNSLNEGKRQQSEMATNLLSSREQSETDFRRQIFQ